MESSVRCHYEVLGVPRDAENAIIKKAHRKLALKYHPDKNPGDAEANREFLLVQQAYECLSDASERKWYDEHRTAILKGWSASGTGDGAEGMLFDVVPFMHASCYSGYGDDSNGFFAVYGRVFASIFDEEQEGKDFDINQSEGDARLVRDFGQCDEDWQTVATFYQLWESFSSEMTFAWADQYDTTEVDHRRMRRAMDNENRRERKAAKKERNETVVTLVKFVKRRDPRVAERRKTIEKERIEREQALKDEAVRKKREAAEARELWRQETAIDMTIMEQEDRIQGRIRLADLDDDYDYGGKKGKSKTKTQTRKEMRVAASEAEGTSEDDQNESTDEESGVEEMFRCECCKKDFKSDGQLQNHKNSKKHKAAMKRYNAN